MLIIANHKEKVVYPIDLKTSSKPEWDFYKSFVEWGYSQQSRLYWRLIRQAMNNDEYFKDFYLDDYRFIVVNRFTLTPLVWKFEDTQTYGTITKVNSKGYTTIMRDPCDVGKELTKYLSEPITVPHDVSLTSDNSINYHLSK